MQLPKVHGVIRRRLLVNFRVDPQTIRAVLPAPFAPKLHDGHAIAGICLIRLEAIRPKPVPAVFGIASENAAHRIAVTWQDGGVEREGVYIPRRDTGSLLNHLVGGRLFPGEHQRATFDVADDGERIALDMRSADGRVTVGIEGRATDSLPSSSAFRSVAEASSFFAAGSVGYSATTAGRHLDGVVLKTSSWSVGPLSIARVHSSYFSDAKVFPEGSITFDCALVMRNIAHEWEPAQAMYL